MITLRCIKCHRPMRRATPNGMGPVCGKGAKPMPVHERDLFGFNVAAAAGAAMERVRVHIEMVTVDAVIALRHEFAAARRRLGVWS